MDPDGTSWCKMPAESVKKAFCHSDERIEAEIDLFTAGSSCLLDLMGKFLFLSLGLTSSFRNLTSVFKYSDGVNLVTLAWLGSSYKSPVKNPLESPT